MFILDSHCDTPSMFLEQIDISKENGMGHVNIPKIAKGGVDGLFWAIYTPASFGEKEAMSHALSLISKCYDVVDCNKDRLAFAFSVEQALENRSKGLISIFMGMENGSPIGEELSYLRFFYKMGIRYLTLCHSKHNQICDSCAPVEPLWNGLSPFGVEVVKEMNRLGMLVDCSHISDKAFYDVLNYSEAPVVATHSSCRAICSHPRNMSDQMIKDLASVGGVIQINFYPLFIDEDFKNDSEIGHLIDEYDKWQGLYRSDLRNEVYRDNYIKYSSILASYPAPSYKRVVDHIEHVISLVGTKHVGLGSDFDGIGVAPQGLRDISDFKNIIEELRLRGYSESDIEGIAGGNFLRVMSQVAQIAQIA